MDYKKLVEHLVISGAGNPNNIFDDAATAITELLERAEKAEREKAVAIENLSGVVKSAYKYRDKAIDELRNILHGKMEACNYCKHQSEDCDRCKSWCGEEGWEWHGIKEG